MITRKLLPFFMLSLSTILIFGAQPTSAPITNDQITVIFDMNGVLVETGGATRILGLKKFIAHALTQNPLKHNPLHMKKRIKEKLFELLSALEERQPHEVDARDDHGDILPQSMCNWMKGTRTPEQLRAAVDAELARRPQDLEASILHDIAHMMFTPEKFAQTQHVVPEAVAFVAHLKQQGYKTYILSNFCSRSFEVIKNEHPEVFKLFDGIVISGGVGLIKPDPNVYKYLLTVHNIDSRKACFIDDVSVNVQAAQAAGITSFICPLKSGYLGSGSPDIEAVKKEFHVWRDTLSSNTLAAA